MKQDNFQISKSTTEERNLISRKIDDYNRQKKPFTQKQDGITVSYHIRAENGDIAAGVNATMYAWGILFIEALYVEERYRKQGLGSRLLRHAEDKAKEKGAYIALLDTFDFQAKDFYLQHGYEIFGTVDDCPPGHTRFHFKKRL